MQDQENRFSISSSAYLAAVKTAARAVVPKPVIPALSNLRFEVQDGLLTVSASDTETTIRVRCETVACAYEGTFLVPNEFAVEPFKGLNTVLDFEISGTVAYVSWKGGMVTLPALSDEDWPLPEDNTGEAESGVVDAVTLKEALEMVDYACSKDDIRPVLQGVLFEFLGKGLDITATNAHILTSATVPKAESPKAFLFVLPKKTAAVVKAMLGGGGDEIIVSLVGNSVSFSLAGGWRVIEGRLLEGKFPNWRAVVPKDLPHYAVVSKEALCGAWERVDACTGDNGLLRIELRPPMMELSGRNLGWQVSGMEEVSCDTDSGGLVLGCRTGFFGMVTDKIPGTKVRIEMRDARSNIIFRDAEEEEYKAWQPRAFAMLTPMMLSDELS